MYGARISAVLQRATRPQKQSNLMNASALSSSKNTRTWILLAIATASAAATVWIIRKRRRHETAEECRITKKAKNLDFHGDTNQHPGVAGARRTIGLPTHMERELYKESRRKRMIPKLAMKKPMYDNIRMCDPDGILLSSISLKKARWYVKKNLASWISDDCIQLNFQPKKGLTRHDQNQQEHRKIYNQNFKINQCVVCGADERYMRHYVVPYVYRSQFPSAYKTHLPHDVVLLCPECHVTVEKASQRRMRSLEQALRQQLSVDPKLTSQPFFVDPRLHKVQSSAFALLRWKHTLPESRVAEYESLLREWWDLSADESLTVDHLERAGAVDDKIVNVQYVPGSDLVIDSLGKDDPERIATFVRGWRRHFQATHRPRFLPTGWNIDSPVVSDVRPSTDLASGV